MRVVAGDTEQIVFLVLDRFGVPATGRSTIRVRLYRRSDNWFLDWSDMTFKVAGHTTLDATMAEVDATNAPGHYALSGGFDTSSLVNAIDDDTYISIPIQTAGTDLLPGPGEIVVGFWADTIQETRDRIG